MPELPRTALRFRGDDGRRIKKLIPALQTALILIAPCSQRASSRVTLRWRSKVRRPTMASQVERREAQRPGGRPRKPAACGARAPGQASQACLVSARGRSDRKGWPKGRRSAAPWRLRRSIPSCEGEEKGTSAYPAPPRIRAMMHARATVSPGHSGARALATEPGIQLQAMSLFLDSGFALAARPGMTGD